MLLQLPLIHPRLHLLLMQSQLPLLLLIHYHHHHHRRRNQKQLPQLRYLLLPPPLPLIRSLHHHHHLRRHDGANIEPGIARPNAKKATNVTDNFDLILVQSIYAYV